MEEEKAQRNGSVDHEEHKPVYRGLKTMPFIIGNETFEKLGTIGTLSNLTVYLTAVFNMKNVSAATLINIFMGTSNIAPFFGAYLSDTYFGRYKTLGFASISSLLGLIVINLTAIFSALHPPQCSAQSTACLGPTAGQLAFLLTGFGLMVIGAGGIRPCNFAFGADQFDPTTESGQRGVDSFFNWYYFTLTFAVMVSSTLIVYVQSDVSWAIGFAIPTGLMLLSCALLFLGSRLYVKVRPDGSPITSLAQVLVAAVRKRRLTVPDQLAVSLFNHVSEKSINSKLPYTDQFRFLDKSAVITPADQINIDGSASNSWRLCSIQQVEELKCILRVIPIWASAILYSLASAQNHTYGIFQALQSDRRFSQSTNFKIPAASYSVFMSLSLTVWIPVYDRVLVPALTRVTGKEGGITVLQRIGIGIVISVLSMIVAGLVEEKRRNDALTKPSLGVGPKGGAISSMSGYWLVPQLALVGLSEAFISIGLVEFYYKQFPENMRSIAGAFSTTGMAFANYLSGFLVSTVHHITVRSRSGDWLPEDLNKGKLDYFYYMIAALGALNFGYFLVCARWYRYKTDSNRGIVELALQEAGGSEKLSV
ncbi:hypothetical protein CDL15_Pgr025612 [Punica granatum]|uniref:Protein NRT1/ PTR FAMILY 2.11-like n=1 Tax=Punica granatum TaxID=22663 RepID=A0A218WB52_PUNGR|nr:hypothetical protein CDL15_Pgr025612 [Punica granatum]